MQCQKIHTYQEALKVFINISNNSISEKKISRHLYLKKSITLVLSLTASISVSVLGQPLSAGTGILHSITSTKILFVCFFANTQDASMVKEFMNIDNER